MKNAHQHIPEGKIANSPNLKHIQFTFMYDREMLTFVKMESVNLWSFKIC